MDVLVILVDVLVIRVQIGHDPRNDRSRSPEYAGAIADGKFDRRVDLI